MKTLRLGHIELMSVDSSHSEFNYYEELKEWVDTLGDGWEYPDYSNINLFAYVSSLSSLNIYESIRKKYEIRVATQIEVATNRGKNIIIDDEGEVELFFKQEECFGFDQDGEETNTHINNCFNFNIVKTDRVYIFRKI